MFTIDLDGGTITTLMRKPPLGANIVTINLDDGTVNLDGGNEVVLQGGALMRGRILSVHIYIYIYTICIYIYIYIFI